MAFIEGNGIFMDDEREESLLMRSLLDEIINHLSSNTLYSSLNKAGSFFKLIADFVQNNSSMRAYLVKKDIMFRLLDLIMGRESIYMKYHPKAQDLPDHIVFAIYEILTFAVHCKNNFVGVHVENKAYAPFFEATPL